MKKIFIHSFLMMIFFSFHFNARLFAQDVNLSQFYALSHNFNPAFFTIVEEEFTFSAIYQQRFPDALAGAYHLTGGEGNVAIGVAKDDIIAVNIGILKDIMSNRDFNRTSFSIGLAYAKSLSKYQIHYLSIGSSFTYNQQKYGLAGVLWGDQFDGTTFNPDFPTQEIFAEKSNDYSLNIGLQYFGNFNDVFSFYGGVSAFHLVQSNSSHLINKAYKTPLRINGNFGTNISVSKLVDITASLNIIKQSQLIISTVGLFTAFNIKEAKHKKGVKFYVGSYYRISDFIIPTIRLKANGFELGFAYDFALPSFNENYSRFTGPEITLKYGFSVFDSLNKRKGSSKFLNCPKF